ncbi:lecithin retinol acyltransferase-like [Haliotis rubra]|uniref:lecithin retinol acyltransferase-like n=1 Tax=Haliotis rubra TaxID=36100 RepID=UPI001EE53E69|nr:lecithin retinol acyltransferase-like [Haliotis rubra]
MGRDPNHSSTASSSEHKHHKNVFLKSLKPGDMLHIDRGWYYHCGIYVGADNIVHLSGVNGSMESGLYHLPTLSGAVFNKGIVRLDNVWDVAGVMDVVKINVKDGQLLPLEPSEIVNRSLSKVGEGGYNLLYKNCEHFASWCRYDTEESDQTYEFVIKG